MDRLKPHKGHLLLYIVLIVAVLVAMLALRTCSYENIMPGDGDDHRHGGDTINVAMEFSPIGVCASGDTLSGFYYDLLKQISANHGRPVHVTGYNHSSDILSLLEEGGVDVVISDIPLTADMKVRYACTNPVITDRQVLVQLRDTVSDSIPIRSQIDLIDKTVYLPAHSGFESRIENLSREIGGEINVVEHEEYGAEQMLISVALGELPNAVVNKRVATILMRDYPQLDASVELSLNQFQSWLLNPADTLLCDTLNVWLDDFKSTPAFDCLLERYF